MCSCDKDTNEVCIACFTAIKHHARWNPMSELRKRFGEWKCDEVSRICEAV